MQPLSDESDVKDRWLRLLGLFLRDFFASGAITCMFRLEQGIFFAVYSLICLFGSLLIVLESRGAILKCYDDLIDRSERLIRHMRGQVRNSLGKGLFAVSALNARAHYLGIKFIGT